ncbi:M48 family metallopeptidase [Brevundimonas kwangchunensis]|uniref:M48 family metallopeptidase n=1 Tax=Brevundimonas kwangchunensis TaxID=322163 RepID=A0ABN1H3T3_9CAUL
MNWLSRNAVRIAGAISAVSLALTAASPASAQSAVRDTEIETIIHEWSAPVFTAMGLDPDEVEILLINEADLNAFATRGRIMGLNTGLILRTRNPNELLGVIAHEGAHIKNRHTLRDGAQNAGMQPMLMTMALGALAIAAGAPDAGAVLLGNSQYFGTLSALRYMTHQEGEADSTGARALERAGESGRGLLTFFENFRSQEVFSDARRYPYFRSHPLSSARIENIRRLVSEQSNYGKTDSPERMAQHALIRAKIHAFLDAPNTTLRTYPETDVSLPGRYARAIAWYRDGQTDRALAAVDELLGEQPENPYFWELKGQILFEEGRPGDAIAAHQRSVEILPMAPLLRINLAHALIETQEPARLDQAIDQLKRATALERENSMGWRLLSQAYASKGMEGEARLASAEMYFALGARQQATQFALRARDMLQPGSAEWTRAMDIVFASGATQDDLDDLDRRNQRNRPVIAAPASS